LEEEKIGKPACKRNQGKKYKKQGPVKYILRSMELAGRRQLRSFCAKKRGENINQQYILRFVVYSLNL
jgi:hypothetical protein